MLLAVNDVFARFLKRTNRHHAHPIDHFGRRPCLVGQYLGIIAELLSQPSEERLFERKEEVRSLIRCEAQQHP
jgi:hypothetical protein